MYRMRVEIEEHTLPLSNQEPMKRKNVAAGTIRMLGPLAAPDADPSTWFFYFDWRKPDTIAEVVDMQSGWPIPSWRKRQGLATVTRDREGGAVAVKRNANLVVI
jgi:hypothetical protein